jgi:hypothetical protein
LAFGVSQSRPLEATVARSPDLASDGGDRKEIGDRLEGKPMHSVEYSLDDKTDIVQFTDAELTAIQFLEAGKRRPLNVIRMALERLRLLALGSDDERT